MIEYFGYLCLGLYSVVGLWMLFTSNRPREREEENARNYE
jgi:hypothetical protein